MSFYFFSILIDILCRQEVLLLDNGIAFNKAIMDERELHSSNPTINWRSDQ